MSNSRANENAAHNIAGRNGFSLIEVLCAILILGVALVGLTQGITTALTSSKESELQTTAALLASGLIESVRVGGGIIDGETEGSGGEGLTNFRWKQTITRSTLDGLHEVKVVVESAQSGQAIYELQTMLFERPLDTKPKESTRGKKGKSKQRGGARG